MPGRALFDKIELQLVRVLHTVLTERSVSRAAMKLDTTQPAVSAQLRRLRALTGDALLVRAGSAMAPTETGLALIEPAAAMLEQADRIFGTRQRPGRFDPGTSETMFRVAASDYLDPLFLPSLVTRVRRAAPRASIEIVPLSGGFDYRRSLAAGELDLAVGNWLAPPEELRLSRLLSDEVVCLVSAEHPAARGRGFALDRYLAADHAAPFPLHPGARGVIDEHLASIGLTRRIAVRSPHFGLIPRMVADSRLVLTTGRLFCSRFTQALPLRIVRCPVAFPPLTYYQLWHDRSHASPALRWLRDQVREAASTLPRADRMERADRSDAADVVSAADQGASPPSAAAAA